MRREPFSQEAIQARAVDEGPLSLGVPTAPITVNTTVTGDQYGPETVFLADGRFMITWQTRNGGNFDDYDVVARIFNADGTPSGAQFVIDAPAQGLQYGGVVPGYAAGDRFAVVWTSEAGTAQDVFIRFYNTNGQAQGLAAMVNATVQFDQAYTGGVALAGGGFAVAWVDRSGFADPDLKINVYGAQGQLLAANIVLAASASGDQRPVTIEALPGGGFAVAWTDRNTVSGSGVEDLLMLSVFDAAGNPVGTSHTLAVGDNPSRRGVDIIGLESGNIAVVLDEAPGIRETDLVIFNPQGTRIHTESLPFSQLYTTTFGVALANGGFVLMRNEVENEGGFERTHFSIRNANGQVTSERIGITAPTDYGVFPTRIKSLPDGGFVMAWLVSQDFQDSSGDVFEVWIQAFDEAGIGVDQPINLGVIDSTDLDIAVGPDGSITAFWNTEANDGDIRMVFIPASGGSGPPPVTPTAGDDVLTGTAGADTIDGLAGNDTINGLGGNDTLFGGDGSDVLNGDDGNDTLVGNAQIFVAQADTLNGGAGDDLLYGEAADTLNGGTGFDRLIAVNAFNFSLNMATTSIEYAVMDFGNDTIDGSGQSVGVSVFASGGADSVTGSAFGDLIFGGSGNDVINAGAGADALVGEAGVDQLSGGDGDDRVYFDAQDSFVSGGAGYDAGYITPSTGTGVTVNMGAASLEFIQDLAGAGDTVLAASMTVGLQAYIGGGTDAVDGSDFADVIWGEAGDDVLSGNAGDDVIVGGAGLDRISGGAGNDALYGGAADGVRDTFVFGHTGAANADAVYDFVVGTDRIDLSAFGSTFAAVSITNAGDSSIVYLNGQQVCTVVGVTGLTAGDFVMSASPSPDDVTWIKPDAALTRPVLDDGFDTLWVQPVLSEEIYASAAMLRSRPADSWLVMLE